MNINAVLPFAWLPAILSVLCGYLLGNIQTAIIVSKCYYHDDVRNHGSGNAGSTNMIRVFGLGPGAVTFGGDFIKGALGVLVGWVFMGAYGGYIAGFFVILGHCYPVFAGFRGGKGVASSFGIALMVCPVGAACAMGVGLVLLALTRKVSIMSLSGVLAFFIYTLAFGQGGWPLMVFAGCVAALVFFRHRENIVRIIEGTESAPIDK